MDRSFRFQRVWALLLTVFLLSAMTVPSFVYAEEGAGQPADGENTPAGAAERAGNSYELEDFVNREVLAFYEDGSTEVFAFDSEEELADGIRELTARDDVLFVQPNFEYTADALSVETVNDAMFAEQWALYNDGSFEIEDQENDYPVYDDPFEQPSAPGEWINPWPDFLGGWPDFWFGWYPFGASSDAEYDTETDGAAETGTAASTLTSVSGIDINVEEAWEIYRDAGSEKSETVIALIDTGVDTGHEDFGDVFWKNEDEIAGNGIDDDGNGYIDDVNGWNFYNGNPVIYTGSEDSHGTHGAGSIAAASGNGTGISGIVSDGSVKIMVLKALGGRDGSGTTDSVIRAIRYAEANGASICNLSMGTDSYDRALRQTIADSGMLFVISAGNDGRNTDQTPCYPASFDLDNIISAANLRPDGTLHSTSNYGAETVDIAVPGTCILSLTADNTYSYMTGTSMSAPTLSAAAAMLHSYAGGLSAAEMKEILLSTADAQENLSGYVGTGARLNVGTALSYAREHYEELTAEDLPFTDLEKTDSAYEAVRYLYENGIMLGTSETAFSPDSGLNRAMAVTLLGRLAQAEQQETDLFSDVSGGTWYSGYVGWAAQNGLVVGYGNGQFGPSDPVTAEQFDLLLERYAARQGVTFDSGLTGSSPLTRKGAALAFYDLCRALEDVSGE